MPPGAQHGVGRRAAGILSLRLHIFYLGTVRYMNEALDHAQDGNDGALTAINQTASGLLLTQDDLVTSFE